MRENWDDFKNEVILTTPAPRRLLYLAIPTDLRNELSHNTIGASACFGVSILDNDFSWYAGQLPRFPNSNTIRKYQFYSTEPMFESIINACIWQLYDILLDKRGHFFFKQHNGFTLLMAFIAGIWH